jgi:hypothetical protein
MRRLTYEETLRRQRNILKRQLETEAKRRAAMSEEARLVEDLNKECPMEGIQFMVTETSGLPTISLDTEDAGALLEFFTHYEPYPNG